METPIASTLRRAAKAVRELDRRQHKHLSREPDYGIVLAIEPLQVELLGSNVILDHEQMVITQSVRQYDVQYGLRVGDGVKVALMWNGDWLVEQVISDRYKFPAGTGTIVRGSVSGPGGEATIVLPGTGDWTLGGGEGVYVVTFETPFADNPTAVATVNESSTDPALSTVAVTNRGPDFVEFSTYDETGGSPADDIGFDFIAVG